VRRSSRKHTIRRQAVNNLLTIHSQVFQGHRVTRLTLYAIIAHIIYRVFYANFCMHKRARHDSRHLHFLLQQGPSCARCAFHGFNARSRSEIENVTSRTCEGAHRCADRDQGRGTLECRSTRARAHAVKVARASSRDRLMRDSPGKPSRAAHRLSPMRGS